MKIQQYYEDKYNEFNRFEITIESKTLELHSSFSEIDGDARVEIQNILQYSAEAIGKILRNYAKRK